MDFEFLEFIEFIGLNRIEVPEIKWHKARRRTAQGINIGLMPQFARHREPLAVCLTPIFYYPYNLTFISKAL
jgi:hypothetical protein